MSRTKQVALVVVLAILVSGSLASGARAQCPSPGFIGGYGASPYGQFGAPYVSIPAPGVADSFSAGGFVSVPFPGQIAGYRCRLICYPVSGFGAASYSGAPTVFGPGYSPFQAQGIPVGYGSYPQGFGGGCNISYFAGR